MAGSSAMCRTLRRTRSPGRGDSCVGSGPGSGAIIGSPGWMAARRPRGRAACGACPAYPEHVTSVRMFKGHGTGNDFVIAPDVDGSLSLSAEQVRLLCDRHRGSARSVCCGSCASRWMPMAQLLVDRAVVADPDVSRPEWFARITAMRTVLAEMRQRQRRSGIRSVPRRDWLAAAARRIRVPADHPVELCGEICQRLYTPGRFLEPTSQ